MIRAVLLAAVTAALVSPAALAPLPSGGAGGGTATPATLLASAEAKQPSDTFAPCPSELPEGMVCIPGGSFTRGGEEGAHATPAEVVTVSTFLLDVHEVTNAQWNACVAAGECRRLTRFAGYLGADQPAVSMRWDEAVSFCERAGGRLPTEAEWERAASGPNDTLYPWGDAPGTGCENAIVMTREGHGCGRGVTWPVMSRPAYGYGLYDMAGNAWEWVQDVYSPCYGGCDHACGAACSGRDPRGPCDGAAECEGSHGLRVVRGGSWWHDIDRAVVTERRGVPALNPNPHRFGFRCARNVP